MISFLVLNIISSALTLCLIVPALIEISSGRLFINVYRSVNSALYCLLIIISLVQAVTSIAAARYSCLVVCGQNHYYPATVIFASDPTTINQSTFVPVALNVETPTSSEQNDQSRIDYYLFNITYFGKRFF